MSIYRDDKRGVRQVLDIGQYEGGDVVTCGTCGRSWDDAVATSATPAPSARCPFEYSHVDADEVLTHYVAAALWTSHHYESEQDDNPVPMDSVKDADDIADEARAEMRADVEAFLQGAHPDALAYWSAQLGDAQIGHDFWLTRNRHGAGFWDRFGAGEGAEYGRMLTDDAHAYGDSELYVGDDGRVYVN
jgi:hypothetical protein